MSFSEQLPDSTPSTSGVGFAADATLDADEEWMCEGDAAGVERWAAAARLWAISFWIADSPPRTTARLIRFSSSRMLPGQSYSVKSFIVSSPISEYGLLYCTEYFL